MARTLDLIVREDDARWILEEVARRGGVFVSRDSNVPGVATTTIPPAPRPMELYLVRKEDLGRLRRDHVELENVWRLDRVDAPVIQFVAPTTVSEEAVPGWLQFQVGYFEQDQWMPFEKAFLDWAGAIFRLIKRRFTRDRETGRYVGSSVRRST